MPFKTAEQKRLYDLAYRERDRVAARLRSNRTSARYRRAHPDRAADSNRRAQAKKPPEEYRRAVNEYAHQWRLRNPDAARLWQQANPDKVRNNGATRRARKHDAFVENVDRATVFTRDNGVCGICRTAVDPTNWHLDHIVPLSRGGEHSYANTQVTHPRCNQQKHARIAPLDKRTHITP